MTEKELKKLKRTELLEMLIDQSSENEQLRLECERLNELLKNRELTIDHAGSIAEASLALSGVFESAQSAADQYLSNIRNSEAVCERIRTDAEEKAAGIIADAEAKAAEIVENAKNSAFGADEYTRSKLADAEAKAAEIVAEAQASIAGSDEAVRSKLADAEAKAAGIVAEAQASIAGSDEAVRSKLADAEAKAAAIVAEAERRAGGEILEEIERDRKRAADMVTEAEDKAFRIDGACREKLAEAEEGAARTAARAEERAAQILAEAEERAAKLTAEAEGRAAKLTAEAEEKLRSADAEAEKRADSYWQILSRRMEKIYEEHPELRNYMEQNGGDSL